MGTITRWMDQYFYPQFSENWDDQIFRDTLLKCIDENRIVLDLGAGAGIVSQMNFRGIAAKVCGIDLDERVLQNPYLDEAKVANASGIPYPDETFDVVFCDNVMEHIDDPVALFSEVKRVLKQGGGGVPL